MPDRTAFLARDINIEDKFVVLAENEMSAKYRDITWRIFHAKGGFGCYPNTNGSAVFGSYVRDGEECRRERYQFERLATDKEVQAARDAGAEFRA